MEWDAPISTGGEAPVDVQCEPASGNVFDIGESTVRCTARDADSVEATCTFPVRVAVSRTLARTRFVAFGDSITQGQVPAAETFTIIEPLESYPYKLEQMLIREYPAQALRILNSGFGGEVPSAGAVRLPGVLDTERPEVLLLQEGTNGLTSARVSAYAASLRTMVSMARNRDIDVVIAYLLPVGPPHTDSRPTKPAAVVQLNERIDSIAAEFGIGPPLDLYSAFEANPALMSFDGLHPTREGYTRIAELFADEIVRRYDAKSTSTILRRFPTMRPNGR